MASDWHCWERTKSSLKAWAFQFTLGKIRNKSFSGRCFQRHKSGLRPYLEFLMPLTKLSAVQLVAWQEEKERMILNKSMHLPLPSNVANPASPWPRWKTTRVLGYKIFTPDCQIQAQPDAVERWRHNNNGSNQCSTRNEQQHRPPIPPAFWQENTDTGWHYQLPAGHAQQVGQEHHSLQEFFLLNIVPTTALLLIRPRLWNWCHKTLPVTAEVGFSILRCFRLSKTIHFW